jgi:hypothetical protein
MKRLRGPRTWPSRVVRCLGALLHIIDSGRTMHQPHNRD